ncbi:unnamed protein product [Arctia plantaginis]|uniref:Peptidase S1 domain-containing protein n=1 Tax=Arctia plantaginis TaxID=874455 RepID=A0A8S1B8R4_ARCPL|nr:unnamed protein product [Arctia plantaginis]
MVLFTHLTIRFIEIITSWFLCYMVFGKMVIVAEGLIDKTSVLKNLTKPGFNFAQLLATNAKYSPMTNQCSLRIYGGQKAARGSVPYQVALRRVVQRGRRWVLFCGGAIVTPKHVATAAHCFEAMRLRQTRVIAGTVASSVLVRGRSKFERLASLMEIQRTETWRKIAKCYEHSRYNRKKIVNDFAVLQIEKAFIFSSVVQPIPILTAKVEESVNVPDDTLCLVSGYGLMEYRQHSLTLRKVCVPTVSYASCARFYRLASDKTQVCAGSRGKDSCQGDSGGPMTCKGYLIGVVSFGGKCGEAPGVYTRKFVFAKKISTFDNNTFDFREIVKENERYPSLTNICQLRIYGGVTATRTDVPYQVALRREENGGQLWIAICGGAIVTENYVLTAAHCLEIPRSNIRSYRVIAGTIRSSVYLFGDIASRTASLQEFQAKETWRRIAEYYKHAFYNRKTIRNDIGVILLDKPLEFSEFIKPIRMINGETPIESETLCTTSGFGLMEWTKPSPFLRYVCVPVVPFYSCKKHHDPMLYSSYTQICAGSYGKDSCQGDSGGPMACKGLLVGLVSFGARCGEAPGVYTLVSGYTSAAKVPFVKSGSVKVNFTFTLTLLYLYSVYCLVWLLTQVGTMTVILILYTIDMGYCYLDMSDLDFRDVILQNRKYPPLEDRCHLRVYGGVTAAAGDIPYQVAIRKQKNQGRVWSVFCGGAIVTTTHVVTAAHCFDSLGPDFLNTTRVIAGTVSSNINLFGNKNARRVLLEELETTETWRQIAECYIHADYNKAKIRNDFAVLVLDQPVVFSNTIKPIRMADYNTKLQADTPCTTSGYGLMDGSKPSPSLRYVCIPLVLYTKCKQTFPILHSSYTQICAGSEGKDSCQGDSGGPMACKGVLIGLVSFGAKCGKAPGVYTLISGFTKGNRIPLVKSFSTPMSNAEGSKKNNKPFDFRDVVQENKKYTGMPNICQFRIYGGMVASQDDVPYQVVINRKFNFEKTWINLCGGAIITKKHVLSAAHCFQSKSRKHLQAMRVVAGAGQSTLRIVYDKYNRRSLVRRLNVTGIWRRIADWYNHAKYEKNTVVNDIAVLVLEQKIKFSDKIYPVRMITGDTKLTQETLCVTSGFGLTEENKLSSVLQMVCVPIIPLSACKKIYSGLYLSDEVQICAGSYGKDSCQGDSGGPLVCKGILTGIVSFGADCGLSPGIYTSIASYTTGGANIKYLFGLGASRGSSINHVMFLPILTSW